MCLCVYGVVVVVGGGGGCCCCGCCLVWFAVMSVLMKWAVNCNDSLNLMFVLIILIWLLLCCFAFNIHIHG